MKQYEGCSITTGFLTGNLGEMSYAWRAYKDALHDYLEKQFPGAEVNVKWEHAQGVTPIPLQTTVYIEGGEYADEVEMAEKVDDTIRYLKIEDWYIEDAEMLYTYLMETMGDGQAAIGVVSSYFAGRNIEYHTVMLDDVLDFDDIDGWEEVTLPQDELESLMTRCLVEENFSGAGEGYRWQALKIDESLWIYPAQGW